MKKIIQSVLKPFGLRLAHLHPQSATFGLDVLFSFLIKNGFAPRHIIDVGANHGHWTRKAIEYFPDAVYTLVEPQDHLKINVQDLIASGRVRWINAGAGDSPGRFPFDISYRDDSSSFVLSPASTKNQQAVPVLTEIKTLDQVVATSNLQIPELVKIDAEGFDLKVLAGAKTLFGKTEVFLVEASICCPSFENTALKVIHFMDDGGYKLLDITDMNRAPKNGTLWLCEFAFVRIGSPLLESSTSYE